MTHCREELCLRTIRFLRRFARTVLRLQQLYALERLRRLIADGCDVAARVVVEHAPLVEA